jgi:prenyltransferase beta subunit
MKTRRIAPFALLIVSLPAFADGPDHAKATVAYLCKLQTKDGGFAADATKTKPSLRATSSALRALKYLGGDVPDRAAAERFVVACHDKDSGGFADSPGGPPDVATTAVGAMALVELKLSTAPYEAGVLRYLGAHARTVEEIRIAAAGFEALGTRPPVAEQWLRQIESERKPDGSFGALNDARINGGMTVIVLRLGGKVDNPAAIVAQLDASQHADGGFGAGRKDQPSELETTYRVMRCYHMLKAKPASAAALQAFIRKCYNKDGGYGVAPGQPSSVSAIYFASIIRHWLGER